jgi:hypothetical protein
MIATNSASSSYDVRISALIGGQHRPHRAAHLCPGAVWEPGVQHGDIPRQRRDSRGRLARGPGLTDDLDVLGALEQEPEPRSPGPTVAAARSLRLRH